jgi:hypothetical protein
VTAEELAPGLWVWASGDSRSVYYEAPEAIVLVDPHVPGGADEERFWWALDRDVARLGRRVTLLFTGAETADAGRFDERYGAGRAVPAGVSAVAGGFLLEAPGAVVTAAGVER